MLITYNIGTTHTLQGSLFLKRNWTSDKTALINKLQDIVHNRFPRPFWIAMYPEGTRITPDKRIKSQEYAKQNNLPILNNVLLPRTKGFTTVLQQLHTTLDAIYDVTAGYKPDGLYLGHVLRYGQFNVNEIHMNIERINIHELPIDSNNNNNDNSNNSDKTEKDISNWLLQRYVHKDNVLEYFNNHGHFDYNVNTQHNNNTLHNQFRMIFTLWSITVILFYYMLLHNTTILYTQILLTIATLYKSYLHKKHKTEQLTPIADTPQNGTKSQSDRKID